MLLSSSKTGFNTLTKTLPVLNRVKQEPLCSTQMSLRAQNLACHFLSGITEDSDIQCHFWILWNVSAYLSHLFTFCDWAFARDSEGNFCHLKEDLGGSGKWLSWRQGDSEPVSHHGPNMTIWLLNTGSQAPKKHPALCSSPAVVQTWGRDMCNLHPSPTRGSAC